MTKKTAWSHLPNATHIDRILASVKSHPNVWKAAGEAASWDAARDRAWTAAGEAASWDAARDAARTAALDAARYAAWTAARTAIAALVAWDNSAKFLDMTSNELKMWAALSEDPAAILMLPAVMAIEQLELV